MEYICNFFVETLSLAVKKNGLLPYQLLMRLNIGMCLIQTIIIKSLYQLILFSSENLQFDQCEVHISTRTEYKIC